MHSRLREHFHQQATPPISTEQTTAFNWQAKIEEAYHALALGDPGPAIALGTDAQRTNIDVWEPLLEAVEQAPTELIPANIEKQADDAGVQADRHHDAQNTVAAVVLYTWLLTAAQGNLQEVAGLQYNLGTAYWDLPAGDRPANLKQAIACYQAALQVYHLAGMDYYLPMVRGNLETAKDALRNLEED